MPTPTESPELSSSSTAAAAAGAATNTVTTVGAAAGAAVTPLQEEDARDAATEIVPNARDVLCGRGKGIRYHPGNVLFNRLLRDNYKEYGSAPKGSKALIVKKIIAQIREGQPGGPGRFLEDRGGRGLYQDIGGERTMNKTAQAFRDIRVTEEKHQQQSPTGSGDCSVEKSESIGDGYASGGSPSGPVLAKRQRPFLFSLSGPHQRRPTFQERLAMLKRQQQENRDDDSSGSSGGGDDDDEGGDSSDEENSDSGDVSDTETEDSFPVYDPDNGGGR